MTLDLEHIKQIKREPIKIQVPEWGGSIEARFVTVGQFTSFRKRMKNLAEEDIKEFFREEEKGYSISSEVRECVTFRTGDVLKYNPGAMHSLIVCRNLLIYFARENQEKIISGFSRNLFDGGYLMLGKAETLIGKNRLFFQSVSPTERIYRLRETPLADNL